MTSKLTQTPEAGKDTQPFVTVSELVAYPGDLVETPYGVVYRMQPNGRLSSIASGETLGIGYHDPNTDLGKFAAFRGPAPKPGKDTYQIRLVGDMREFHSWHFKYPDETSLHPHNIPPSRPIVITMPARDGMHIPGTYTNEHGDTITIVEVDINPTLEGPKP
jgi:hypothetical protein